MSPAATARRCNAQNGRFAGDGRVIKIRELGGGMISPDSYIFYLFGLCARLLGQLRASPVLIQHGHREEIPRRNIRCRSLWRYRALVLHGLPTTRTLQAGFARSERALPCTVKIPPLIFRRSPRSIPALRGTLPTKNGPIGVLERRLREAVCPTESSKGNAQSSHSIQTPFKAGKGRLKFQ